MERAQRGVWRQCGITWHCNQMKYAARTEFLINDSPGEAVHVVPCLIPQAGRLNASLTSLPALTRTREWAAAPLQGDDNLQLQSGMFKYCLRKYHGTTPEGPGCVGTEG